MGNGSKLSDLAESSLCFSTERISVRMEDSVEEVEQTKLVVAGTPEGFRWLAYQLEQMAKTAEESSTQGCSAIVAPSDFPNRPIAMKGWDSLDLECLTQSKWLSLNSRRCG
jgi:hypothetical protein